MSRPSNTLGDAPESETCENDRLSLAKRFMQAPDGGYHFGEISTVIAQAAGMMAGKVRLTPESHAHIMERRGTSLQSQFGSVCEFVSYVARCFDAIYRKPNSKDGEAFDLVVLSPAEGEHSGRLIIRLEKSLNGDYYDVKTATRTRQASSKTGKHFGSAPGPARHLRRQTPFSLGPKW